MSLRGKFCFSPFDDLFHAGLLEGWIAMSGIQRLSRRHRWCGLKRWTFYSRNCVWLEFHLNKFWESQELPRFLCNNYIPIQLKDSISAFQPLCKFTFQQHGSVYWKRGARDMLQKLDPRHFLHEEIAFAFAIQHSPVWMDSSTTEYCTLLEEKVGGPEVTSSPTWFTDPWKFILFFVWLN